MAEWLNQTFFALDGGIFNAMNAIQCQLLNTFCKLFSYIGEKGIGFILAGLVLCCFSKTRKVGACTLFAILIGAVFTNVILKNAVARPRPYTTADFNAFWVQAGSNLESEFSFPSGHTTAATAFCVAFFLCSEKKWGWALLFIAPVMAFCRVYLIVHYFTDVVAGLLVGCVAGVLAKLLINVLYTFFESKKDKKLFDFILNKNVFDIFKSRKDG